MQTKKVKIGYRNFFHVYGVILFWIGFIFITLFVPEYPLFQPVLFGLLVGSIVSLVIFNKRYLLTLEINDSRLKINYFRFYLSVKNIQYSIEEIDKIICIYSDILSRTEIVLILKNDKKKYKFDIPRKKMIEFLNMKIELSNLINIVEKYK